MAARNTIAIEIGRRRLRALLASRERGVLRVQRVLVEDIPEGMDAGDAAALGSWLGERLGAAGFGKGRATIAVAREHVGLKRIALPTVDGNELPEMTRLALQRELPFDADQAVIDYVPVERGEASTTVMAVAVPESVLEHSRRTLEAAGLSVERIALRAMGSAALLKSLGTEGGACVLVVDVTGDGVEFCVLEGGVIRFSRAGEVPAGETSSSVAEAVVTETRRTWMSYRIVEGTTEVQRAVVMGDRRVAEQAARPIGEMLKADAVMLDDHPLVEGNGKSLDRVWPLAGLLLEPMLAGETVDFAHPRRAIDRAGRLRRRVLLAAGLIIVALVAGWAVGQRQLRGLEGDLARLRARQAELSADVARYSRDTYTLAHLKEWSSVKVRWLEHLRYVDGIAPPRRELVLDSWVGTLDFKGVRYDKSGRKWSSAKTVKMDLDGEAKDRATADAFRERLVGTEWLTASSSGTDSEGGKRLPFGFAYRLRTGEGVPPGVAEADSAAADRAAGEGGG